MDNMFEIRQSETTPIISIIVPVYNVEKYLDKCIKSILAQTLTDFELILVDDGSEDRSGEMCDKYLKIDSRIKVIHKENGGLSSARNAGIDIASGCYIGFIDSDDYIEPDMYELLYNNIIKENADISICGRYHCYDGKAPKKDKKFYRVCNTKDAIIVSLQTDASISACNKLYKKKLFKSIRYPVNKNYEDAFIIVELLMECHTVVFDSEQKYYYYHRNNSITTQNFSPKCLDEIEAWQKNYDLLNLHYPDLHNIAKKRLCNSYFIVLDKILNSNDEYKYIDIEKKVIKFLKKNAEFIIFKSDFSLKRKFSMFVLLFGRTQYKKIVEIRNKVYHIYE